MPQMAPIMWLPLFVLIILLMTLMKSCIYFISGKPLISSASTSKHFTATWPW